MAQAEDGGTGLLEMGSADPEGGLSLGDRMLQVLIFFLPIPKEECRIVQIPEAQRGTC